MHTILTVNHWNLILQSSLEDLQKIPVFIDEIPPLRRLKEDKLYFLKLSLHELAANAITHGNHSDTTKKVEINLEIEREKIIVTVSDEGSGFSNELYNQTSSLSPSRSEGGRGLRLVGEFMELVSMKKTETKFLLRFVLNA